MMRMRTEPNKTEWSRIRAVIFDMDGVIFDSERATFNEWVALADRYGLKDIVIPYRQCIGVNARRTKEIMVNFYGPDFPYDVYAKETSLSYHAKYDGGRLPLKTGVLSLLEKLNAKGIWVALASSTRVAIVKQQLEDAKLLQYFDRVIGGDMITKSKPAPDIFLAAIEGTDIVPAECAVIEDSYNGIRAAHAAGMVPIMVPDMLPPNEEMEKLAAMILPDLNAVRECMVF